MLNLKHSTDTPQTRVECQRTARLFFSEMTTGIRRVLALDLPKCRYDYPGGEKGYCFDVGEALASLEHKGRAFLDAGFAFPPNPSIVDIDQYRIALETQSKAELELNSLSHEFMFDQYARVAELNEWSESQPSVRSKNVTREVVGDKISHGSSNIEEVTSTPTRGDSMEPQVSHTPDFCAVNWFGRPFEFTPSQAPVVRLLWEGWSKGRAVSKSELINISGRDCSDVRDIFKSRRGTHPAWKSMIVSGEAKGTYRLKEPGK